MNKRIRQISKDSFFEHTSDGIVIVDMNACVLQVNRAFEKMHGWTKEEIIGKTLPMVPVFLLNEAMKNQQKVLAGEEVSGVETYLLRKDGSMFQASVTLSPIKNNKEQIIALVGVERDITDQKLSEQKLQESEQRYRQLIDVSPEPIIVYTDFVITFVNEAAVKLVGAVGKEQILGNSFFDFIHPDYLKALMVQVEQLFVDGKPSQSIEKKILRLDRQVIDVEVTAIPIHYLGKPSIQLLCRDITDRKKAEEALRENEKQYRRVIKLLPEPIIVHNNETILYINDAGVKLLGAETRNEIIDKSLFDFIHPDYHTCVRERLRSIFLTNDHLEFSHTKLITLDNTCIDSEGSSIYVYKYLGTPVVLTVFRDLTERIQTEELIRRSEKLSVVGQLAAGIAHEIRNPLTSLKGFAQLIKKQENPHTLKYIDIMLKELDRINFIVSEFMLIAKPNQDDFQDKWIPGIIEDVVSLLESQAILSNVGIQIDNETDAISTVLCDENQIKQVFINLLKNAIEAMSGGGTIHIIIRQFDSHQIRVRIVDHGIGIPDQIIAKIGEPFLTTKENGTGLGLMVCYRIIEAHKGTMIIKSKEGHGTTIDIDLPLKVKT
jgi:two-component system sporulation sensor kinase A